MPKTVRSNKSKPTSYIWKWNPDKSTTKYSAAKVRSLSKQKSRKI